MIMSNALQKMASLINGNSGYLDIKIPVLNFQKGYSEVGVSSLGGAANSLINSAQNVIQATKMGWCMFGGFTSSGFIGAWAGMLNIVANSALAVAASIAGRLANLAKGQITQALSQVLGTTINTINTFFGFANSILGLMQSIKDLYESFKKLGDANYNNFLKTEDCEYIFAAIAACMLNQLLRKKT